jgi:hypothetical protein
MAAFPAVGATPQAERASSSFDSSPSLDDPGWKSIPRNGNADDASSTQPSYFYCITQATSPKTDDVVFGIVNSQLYYPGKMCIQPSFGYDCTPVVSGKDVSINLCGKKHRVPETQNAQFFFRTTWPQNAMRGDRRRYCWYCLDQCWWLHHRRKDWTVADVQKLRSHSRVQVRPTGTVGGTIVLYKLLGIRR